MLGIPAAYNILPRYSKNLNAPKYCNSLQYNSRVNLKSNK